MKKYILLLVFGFLCLQSGWAQDRIPSVGILKVEYSDKLPKYKAVKIDRYLESAFYKANRFNIVTRQLLDGISQEREMQKELIDNYIIEQGKAVGADYIVKGYAKSFTKTTFKSSPKSRNTRTYRPAKKTTKPKESPRKPTTSLNDAPEKINDSKKQVFTNSTSPKTSSPRNSSRTSPRNSTSTTAKDSKSTSTNKTSRGNNSNKSNTGKTKAGTRVNEKEKPKPKTSSKKPASKQVAPPSSEIDQVYTSTQISFYLKIIDVKTGVVKAQKTYKGSINGVDKFIKDLVASTFPHSYNILEILEMKGDKKAKHVLLDGGFKHGLTNQNYLNVYEVSEENVDGKKLVREVQVGMLRVKRVDTGGHFSLCKIYRGKKKILQKINSGVNLVCKLY